MKDRSITAFIWDFLGKGGNQLVSFIIGIILARLLSPTEYGLIGMAMVFISFTSVFTNLGLSSALIQRSDPHEVHFSSSFYLNLFAGFFLFVLFFVSAPLVARFFNEPQITTLVRVLSTNILFTSVTIVQEARLTRELRFDTLAKARVLATLVSGIIGISLAFIGFGVWSLVCQTLSNSIIRSTYIWITVTWRPKFLFQINAIKELWTFGFHMFLVGLINTAYGSVSTIVIGKIFSLTDLGLYSRAESLNRFVIKYSAESVGSVTYPIMAMLQNSREELIDFGIKTQRLVAFLSFFLLGLLYLTAEPLILVLLGEKWKGAIEIYKLLCLSGFTIPIGAVATNMFKAYGKSREFFNENNIKKVFGFIGMGVGFLFGLKGFLISLIIIGLFSVILDMYYVQITLDYSLFRQIRSIIIYPILVVFLVVAMSFIPKYSNSNLLVLVLTSIVYSLIYLLINHLLRTKGLGIFTSQLKIIIEKLSTKYQHLKGKNENVN